MSEHGVAGLSLGEVSRRMGIRPPSLYVYFPSKDAVYDELFARGWGLLNGVLARLPQPEESTDLYDHLFHGSSAFVHWCIEHPVYTQLMMWRPVPGYEPPPQAYAAAVACAEGGRHMLTRLQQLDLLRQDVSVDEMFGAWTVLITGVVTQQLANAPGEPYERGTFTGLLPQLLSMYVALYAPPVPTRNRAGKVTRS